MGHVYRPDLNVVDGSTTMQCGPLVDGINRLNANGANMHHILMLNKMYGTERVNREQD